MAGQYEQRQPCLFSFFPCRLLALCSVFSFLFLFLSFLFFSLSLFHVPSSDVQGIPIIYYGTEQAFSGGDDPANREDLWHTTYDTGNPLFQFIKGLIQARKQLPSDFFNATLEEKYVEDDFYAYERWDVLVATTNGGNGYAVRQWWKGGGIPPRYLTRNALGSSRRTPMCAFPAGAIHYS